MAKAECVRCPDRGRSFNGDGSADCWCLQVERDFDYEAMIIRPGAAGYVFPVCLTGRSGLGGGRRGR